MPIWMNVIVVLAMALVVLWGIKHLIREIDHSMENSDAEDAPAPEDKTADEDRADR